MTKKLVQPVSSKASTVRYTPSGRGVYGCVGKPPNFRVVRHKPDEKKVDTYSGGRVVTSGVML